MGNNCYKTPPDKWVSNKIFLLQLGILQNKKLVCVAAEAAETSLCSAVQTCPASSTELIQSAPELSVAAVAPAAGILSDSSLSSTTLRRQQIKDGPDGVSKTSAISLQVAKTYQERIILCSSSV